MSNVLVFLPEEFNCYSKIDRKLTRITSSFSNFKLSCPHDSHSLLKQYYAQNTNCTDLIICEEWKNLEYTHVVIFDDGEVFTEEVSFFQKNKIPLRIIPVKITRVINIHHHPKFQNIKKSDEYEYIGRGSVWGNPYAMNGAEQESREEVINKFKYDFDKDILMKAKKEQVYLLAGKRLGCFCKPHDCHGDVIAHFLNKWDDGL